MQLPVKGWRYFKLKDIGIIVSGGTPSTKEQDYWGDEIVWITPADLSGYTNKYISIGRKSITKKGLKNSSAKILPKGSMLFSSRAPIGYVAIASNELCTNQGFKNIIPNSFVNNEYLFYYLKASKGLAEKFANGTTFKEISAAAFAELPIPIPSIEQQVQIVIKIEQLFSELDKSIELLKAAQQQLNVYRQSVLKWAFEGKLTNENIEGSRLPVCWKQVQIKEICNVVRGGSPRPAGDLRFYEGNIPFLKVADLTRDSNIYLRTYSYTIKEAGLSKTRQIKPNTLLLSNSGATLGVPKICMIDATMNDGIAAFLDLDPRSNLFLYYFWQSKTNELRNINQGAAQPNLNTDLIKNYIVPYCSFEEQQKVVFEIESRLSVTDKLQETITNSLKQAEALKQSILKQAFEGKLV